MKGLKRTHTFRHSNYLDRCEATFASLLGDLRWTTVADLLATHLADA